MSSYNTSLVSPFTKKSKGLRRLSSLAFFFIASLTVLFFVTRGAPYTSELAFIEHSVLGKNAGSVIPASCDSVPPTSHSSGDCPRVCTDLNTTDPAAATANTTYDPITNKCVCKNGNPQTSAPYCLPPPRVQVTFTGNGNPNPFFSMDMTADTTYVYQGDSTFIRWTITGNPVCTPSGYLTTASFNAGSPFNTGTYSLIANGTKSYTLSCTDGVTTITKTQSVYFEGRGSSGCGTNYCP